MAIALSGSLILSGSITVSGSIISTGTISMSGSIASASYANNATTASYALNATTGAYANNATSASYALNATTFNGLASSIFATTGSNTFVGNQVVSGSLTTSGSITATGTITAQTLVVQTITSSTVYSSGSNIFGNAIGNTQTFTGSVLVTGSLTIAGASSATSYNGATIFGSTIACSPIGCFATSCATSFIGGTMSGTTIYGSTAVCSPVGLFSGCVGIGITSPSANLDINSTGGVGGWTGIRLKTGTSSVQSLSMGQVTAGNGAWIGTAQYNQAGYWQTEGTAASVINFASDGTFQISTNCGLTANTNYNLCQRLTIASNGYVGINNSTPIDSLTVCGAIVTTKNTILTNCNAAIFDYNSPGGRMLAYTTGGSILQFYTNYTGCGMAERVRIDACGNVGIGCNAPIYKLDVLGGGLRITDTEANIVLNSCGGGSGIWRLIGSTGATTKLFRIFDADNAIDRFNITAGGYIGMGHTTPPYNLTICCTGQVIINVRTSTTTSGSESGLLITTPDSIGLVSVGSSDARGVNTAVRCDMVIGLRTGGRMLFTTDPNANYHNLALTCGNNSGGGHLIPYTTGIQNLGCATNRFGTVYTSDLSLSNGIGDYTIVEGESDLFIYNNKQCKVYKFMLQEVCTECAIPKKS